MLRLAVADSKVGAGSSCYQLLTLCLGVMSGSLRGLRLTMAGYRNRACGSIQNSIGLGQPPHIRDLMKVSYAGSLAGISAQRLYWDNDIQLTGTCGIKRRLVGLQCKLHQCLVLCNNTGLSMDVAGPQVSSQKI